MGVLTVVVGVLRRVGDRDLGPEQRVARRKGDLVGDRDAEAQRAAGDEVVVVRVGRHVGGLGEQVEAGRQALVQEIGLGEVELDAARALALRQRGAHVLPATEEVGLGDGQFADDAVDRRVAAGHGDGAGGLVLDLHRDDDAVGGRPLRVGDLDLLEEPEAVQAALGLVDQHLVVGVALAELELAADDVVAGAGVALDDDALDVDARALVDGEGDRHGAGTAMK